MEELNEELKKKIESILFAAGKKIEITEIAKLCRLSHNLELVEKVLHQLKKKYESESSPLMLVQEGTEWKLTVRERYVQIVQKIVTQTELSKTITETLAVIAYKAPVLQSDIIKIRTNKAYDHLKEIEKAGYITREKKGRTKLIKLSPKFFEYFDVPPEKLRQKFKTVEGFEKAVELKEAEAAQVKEDIKKEKAITKQEEEKIKESTEKEMKKLGKVIKEKEEKLPEVDLIDKKGHKKKLKTYTSGIAEGTELEKPKTNINVVEEKVGPFEVIELSLTSGEKADLIKEAEHLKKEDELAAAGKLEGMKEKVAVGEREKEFKEKFVLFREKEEKEKPPTPSRPAEEKKEEKPEIKAPKAEEKAPERITTRKIAAEAVEERKKQPPKTREGKRLFEKGVPKGVQERIDERVEEIVFGKKEEEKKDKKEKEKEKTPERY